MNTNHDDRRTHTRTGTVSRRSALRGIGGAGIATALGIATLGHAGAEELAGGVQIEPNVGSWATWVLESGDQFRLPPPDPATEDEWTHLQTLAAARDAAALARIAYWDAGALAYRWNELTIQHLLHNGIGGLQAGRALALLNVAIYDATVATWDTKYAHRRPRPADAWPSLSTALPTPASPAYPSEHAVTAGAAATVLGFLFPDNADDFAALAEEAGWSRLLAGTDYPSDVKAGRELGRQVAALAIERAKTDGSDAEWTGSVPTEPGKWNGTNPIGPMGGTWQPWVLSSADEYPARPAAGGRLRTDGA